MAKHFEEIVLKHQKIFHPVVPFNPFEEKIVELDFTKNNLAISAELAADTIFFTKYIDSCLAASKARYGIGGYNELRTIYSRSELFNNNKNNISSLSEEPRRLHLGTDIWGKENTPVFVPLGGMIHSFAFNNQFGDYGVTIILMHQLEGFSFYTLYGHLSKKDIEAIHEGMYVNHGNLIGHFGNMKENGHWPPHLHFQIIFDLETYRGDYPGVCKFSEKEKYLSNCPNPDLILQLNKYLK